MASEHKNSRIDERSTARVGRHATAFELHFHAALRRLSFTDQQCTAIAQLAGPHAKLVTRVHRGQATTRRLCGARQQGQRVIAV
jgi:hypothetical protein